MKKTSKVALVCVTLLTSGSLFADVPQSKIFAETSTVSSTAKVDTEKHPSVQHVSDTEIQKANEIIAQQANQKFSTASARTSSITQAQALTWASNQIGKSLDVDGNGPWCVDFTKAYSEYLFGYQLIGDAYQYASINYDGFTRLSKNQTNPQAGDIAVWTGADNGHVGIVISVSGASFTTLEEHADRGVSIQSYTRNTSGLENGAQPFWGVQRPSLRIQSSQVPAVANAVYRVYNLNNGDHYYTASQYEAQSLVNSGWQYDGIAFYNSTSGGTPIYMLYNPNSGEHFITGSSFEANSLAAAGWNNQGVAWIAPSSGLPVYRLYNPNGFHFWTTSAYEKDSLVAAGWHYEGVAFYG
ncbi:hypothetical protein OfM1_18760 [Lactovum odontotermitis]